MEACCPPLAGVFPGLPVTSSPQVVIRVMATEMIKHQEGGGRGGDNVEDCGAAFFSSFRHQNSVT